MRSRDGDEAPEKRDDGGCALCGRPIPPGAKASRHHLTPKLKGGAKLGTVRLHQICHSAIHARFSEAELARRFADIVSLTAAPELADFLAWVRTKPDAFYAPTRLAGAPPRRPGASAAVIGPSEARMRDTRPSPFRDRQPIAG